MDYLEIARQIMNRNAPQSDRLDDVLSGKAIELCLSDSDSLYIVADEEDVRRLGKPRGQVYTAEEVRCVVRITDAEVVKELHQWKRTFNGAIRQTGAKYER